MNSHFMRARAVVTPISAVYCTLYLYNALTSHWLTLSLMHVLTLYGSTVVSRLTLSYTCSVLHDDDDALCFEACSEATSMTHEPPSQDHSMHFAALF